MNLLDKIKQIMYGDAPQLMDIVTKTMFGYDSKTTSTGQSPNVIDFDPKIPDAYGFSNEHATFAFGRFSVPSSGHGKLIERVIAEANGSPHYIFASHRQDPEKNPLVFEQKVDFMKKFWPDANVYEGTNVRTLFDAIKYLEEQGHKSATLVVGYDRLHAFSKLLEDYAHEYSMTVGVIAVERADDDISATKLRQYVAEDDYTSFLWSFPADSTDIVVELWEAVADGMKLPRIPTVGGQKEGDEKLGTDSNLLGPGATTIRQRRALKRFKQIQDET